MNKIIKTALLQKFGEEQIENLMEVIGATENAEVATEILLGIYEEPIIPATPVKPENFDNSKRNFRFCSYDKFRNRVYYKYNRVIKTTGFAPIGIENPNVTDLVSKRYYHEDVAKDLNITFEECKKLYKKVEIFGEFEKNSNGEPKDFEEDTQLSTWC